MYKFHQILLGTIQPKALGFLDPLVSVSNLYVCSYPVFMVSRHSDTTTLCTRDAIVSFPGSAGEEPGNEARDAIVSFPGSAGEEPGNEARDAIVSYPGSAGEEPGNEARDAMHDNINPMTCYDVALYGWLMHYSIHMCRFDSQLHSALQAGVHTSRGYHPSAKTQSCS